MLRVEDIETVAVEYDLSSSGQGISKATAITAGGVQLCNALEWIEIDPERIGSEGIEVEVCTFCVSAGCGSGGRVSLRRCGEELLWIPSWEAMARGAFELSEYGPPSYLTKHGAVVFSSQAWERLRTLRDGLPALSVVPPLNSRDAARLCQEVAPMRLLGEFPDPPALCRDQLLTCLTGDFATEMKEVEALFASAIDRPTEVTLGAADDVVEPVEFLLNTAVMQTWVPFGRVGGRVCLVVEGGPLLFLSQG